MHSSPVGELHLVGCALTKTCTDVWNTCASERVLNFGVAPVTGDLIMSTEGAVTHLQQEEVDAMCGQSPESIAAVMRQVVLPLVGTNVLLPQNRIGEVSWRCVNGANTLSSARTDIQGSIEEFQRAAFVLARFFQRCDPAL
jgi:tRNA(Glu) U13 pseudouridine synthase TruD